MNIDQLFAELGDGTLPDGLVEELMRMRSALQASTVDNLYVVQGHGFELRLQGAVIDDEAMIGIRVDSPNIQKLLHGSCNVFSLFRLTWVLGGLEVETLEDVLEDEEILEAIHLIVTKGEEADEDAYNLLDFEITQLVSEAFMQGIPAAVIEFALAHTDDLCPQHFTHEVMIGTILWEDRFRNYGVLSLEEAEGLAAKRKLVAEEYIGTVFQPGLLVQFYQWLAHTLTGSAGSVEMVFEDHHQQVLERLIMKVEERKPHLSLMVKVAILGGILWDTFVQEGGKVNLMSLTQGIEVTLGWMVAFEYLDDRLIPLFATQAVNEGYPLEESPKVRTLQYGPW